MIEVDDKQSKAEIVADFFKKAEERDRISAARDGDTHAASGQENPGLLDGLNEALFDC